MKRSSGRQAGRSKNRKCEDRLAERPENRGQCASEDQGYRQADNDQRFFLEHALYFAGFFADFFFAFGFGFGTCGVGGVFSIRRTIRSNAGEGRSLFGFAAMAGV
jgi:hypothetical protein